MLELPVGVTGLGLKSAEAPEGSPATVKVQGMSKPNWEVKVTS
jgi:hypothetical protein